MNKIIDGKEIAKKREAALREMIATYPSPISVVSILVGDDPPSVLYTNLKQKKAQELGINFRTIRIAQLTKFEEVIKTINELNKDLEIDGIMIQLPLPKDFLAGHQTKELIEIIKPEKDIDGLTSNRLVLPAAVKAVFIILEEEKISVKDKKCVMFGTSELIGKPLAKELNKMGGVVQIIDIDTQNPGEISKEADILISATGQIHLIKGSMVKEGAIVIDIGAEKRDGKLYGDVDFEDVLPKVSKITPVPGGVGPVTIVALLENCLYLKDHSSNT